MAFAQLVVFCTLLLVLLPIHSDALTTDDFETADLNECKDLIALAKETMAKHSKDYKRFKEIGAHMRAIERRWERMSWEELDPYKADPSEIEHDKLSNERSLVWVPYWKYELAETIGHFFETFLANKMDDLKRKYESIYDDVLRLEKARKHAKNDEGKELKKLLDRAVKMGSLIMFSISVEEAKKDL